VAEGERDQPRKRDPFGLGVGDDPDPRFSYANERTFLAWCRTALGLMTAGLAITQLLPPFDIPGGRRLIGIPLIIAGTVLAGGSFIQWMRNERAMRLGQPLPRSILLPGVAAVVAVTSLIALVVVVINEW
jgi:putative membrane protein